MGLGSCGGLGRGMSVGRRYILVGILKGAPQNLCFTADTS